MKSIITKYKRVALTTMAILVGLVTAIAPSVYAENESGQEFLGFTMSPMTQLLVLEPGETYEGSITLLNPSNNKSAVGYEIDIRSFYRDDNNNLIFEDHDGYGQMANWITITSPTTGILAPNQQEDVLYKIDVPESAPAGGQYASIVATTTSPDSNDEDDSAVIDESLAMAYTIYAEIAGNTVHQGEIQSMDLPGFIFDGNITGSASIKNTGNSHGTASYTLQVFPLFSNEEIYTNEEDPQLATILPDRTRYIETAWNETPNIGIFNVVYTVEFEGVTEQISKMVIKCPVWLLFIIFFVIAAIIIWIVMRVRSRNKSSKRQSATKTE